MKKATFEVIHETDKGMGVRVGEGLAPYYLLIAMED